MSNRLLERYTELKSFGTDSRTIHHVLKDYIKSGLRAQYETRVQGFWCRADWEWYMKNTMAHYKRDGKALGMKRAMADKYKSTQFTDHTSDAYMAVMTYLYKLYNEGEYTCRKIEPALMFIRERRDEGHWDMIRLTDRHPLHGTVASDEDRDRYAVYSSRVQTMAYLHQLHVSEEVPSQVAYYPTLRAWRDNKAVRTSMGKYLTKYKDMYGLSETDIKSMAEKYQSEINARAGWTLKYAEHNDPTEWERVYDSEAVRSCMRGMRAVRVYAHEKSVLRLAYLVDGTDKIIARCIVRTDDSKGWLRVYPDHNGHSEGRFLLDAIRADGYAKQINLDGVLLKAVQSTGGGDYVCPYIDSGDGGDQCVDVVMRDGVEYLHVGYGDLDASCTDGYVGQSCSCDMCGDSHHEDDLNWIECDEQRVCEYCRDEHYTYAYGLRHEDYFPNEDCIQVGGNWYVTEYAHHHDIHECEITHEWYHSDDMYFFDEGQVCSDVAARVDHPHNGDDVIHPEYVHILSDGTNCHDDDAEHYQAEIDELNEDETTNVEMSQGELV